MRQTVEILGAAYYFEQRWHDARPLLETASKWKPDDSELLSSLARTPAQSGLAAESRTPYSTVFGIDPDSPQSYALASRLLMQEGRMSDVEHLLQRAVELEPDLAGANYELGQIALRREGYGKALELFRRELARDATHSSGWHASGESRLGLGRLAKSVEALKRATWLNNRAARSYLLLGKIYVSQGLLDLAHGMVAHAIEVDPNSYEAHFLQSRVHYKAGRKELARKHLALANEVRRVTSGEE